MTKPKNASGGADRSGRATAPSKRYPPNNVVARRKPCIDCVAEGIITKRKAPHPGPRCSTHHRAKRTLRKDTTWEQRIWLTYGITASEYWEIYDYQQGSCYICRRATGVRKKLSVDHCHATGLVRGLLCTPCNRNVLGHLRDDCDALYRAVDYLMNPPAVDVIGDRITPNGA
jgi:hypothetical protein